MSERHPVRTPEQVIPERRLWFGLVAAPAAWVAEGLFGWFTGAAVCGLWSIGAARVAIGVFSVLMLAVAGAGLWTGLHEWQTARSLPHDPSDRVAFMSMAGVFVSTSFVIAITWSGLSALFIDACGWMR